MFGEQYMCVTWHQSISEAKRLPAFSLNTVTYTEVEDETVQSQSSAENEDLGMISQSCQLCVLCKSWLDIIPK